MRKYLILVVALLAAACATSAPKPNAQAEIRTYMEGFFRTWNAHDAAGIAKNYYRMGPSVEEQTASTGKMFSDLAAQGFAKTDFHDMKICPGTSDAAKAVVGLKFTRLKSDGSAMAPGERGIIFDLKKFDDGWRMTKLVGGDASLQLSCPAA